MDSSGSRSDSPAPGAGYFGLTRWSVVLAAGRSESTHAREALEELCRTYWHPIYSFIRRDGHSPEDAQDLTQEFFTRLLETNSLLSVDPAKGRFRSFLLGSLKHFLANEWDKANAQKRGGGRRLLPIDGHSAETSYAVDPTETLTPDRAFDRRWALTLLQRVLSRLREEYVAEGKTGQFEALKATLTGERRSIGYAEIANRLGTSEGAIKVAAHRLRQRYRQILRDEIAHTVSGPEEIENEIRALFAALES
ncbi:MAG TPA: sigma-70 family RNA polymerase sigma factor [Verrucomicrobiae bacterium]